MKISNENKELLVWALELLEADKNSSIRFRTVSLLDQALPFDHPFLLDMVNLHNVKGKVRPNHISALKDLI